MNAAASGTRTPSVLDRTTDLVRFAVELVAFATFGLWGFLAFPLPWPGALIGIAAPVLAALVWALVLSPRAVFSLDLYLRSLIEIALCTAAAFAWWQLGLPVVAIVFAVVAALAGVLHGRRQLAS